jgi:Concanavalin A-like lectin/glucanases superfamily
MKDISSLVDHMGPKTMVLTGIIALVDIILLALLVAFQDHLIYKFPPAREIRVASFDGRTQDTPVPPPAPHPREALSFRDATMRFDMKVSSISGYANVFQTAGGDDGIRLELAEPAIAAIIIGRREQQGFKVLTLASALELNRWYAVRIVADRDKRVKVYLDDQLVAEESDAQFRYDASDIAVGTGYSRTRPFDGTVRNFTMVFQPVVERPFGKEALAAARVFLLLFLVTLGSLWFAAVLRRHEEKLGIFLESLSLRGLLERTTSLLCLLERTTRRLRPCYLLSAAASGAVLLALLSMYSDHLTLRETKHHELRGLAYDNRASDESLKAVKHYKETASAKLSEIDISFEMKVYRIAAHGNVFQTAPLNGGIRMELSEPNTAVLALGRRGKEPAFLVLSEPIPLNEWFAVRILKDRGQRLQVFLNGTRVIDLVDPALRIDISDIAVGTGFSASRPLDGAVRAFTMDYRLIDRRNSVVAAVRVLNILCLAVILLALISLLFHLLTRLRGASHRAGATPRPSRARVGLPWERVSSRALLAGLAAASLAFVLLTLVSDPLSFREVRNKELRGLAYDNRASDESLKAVKHYKETASAKLSEIDISFEMKVYRIAAYGDVFQTAPLNGGIRMELSEPNTLVMIVGTADDNRWTPLIVSRSIQPNRWYHVRLTIDRHQELRAYLDHVLVAKEISSSLSPAITDFALGTGYSRSRSFDGAVRDFSLRYRLLDTHPLLGALIIALRIALLALLAAIVALLLGRALKTLHLPPVTERTLLFCALMLSGLVATLAYYSVNSLVFALTYPFTSPLFVAPDRFMDFFNINFRAVVDTRYTEYHAIAPPFAFLVARLFSFLASYGDGPFPARDQDGAMVSIFLFLAIFVAFLLLTSYRVGSGVKKGGIASAGGFMLAAFAMVFSYPAFFAADRGNYIILGFAFLYLFLYAGDQKAWYATLALAAAVSMKAHLVLCLVAFADRRHVRLLVDTLAWVVFLNLAASAVLEDFGFFTHFFGNYFHFAGSFAPVGKIFGSASLFTVAASWLNILFGDKVIAVFERVYSPCALAAMLFLPFLVRRLVEPANLRLFYITVILTVMPVASFDYNLILPLLFVPYLLRETTRFSANEITLLCLALVPKTFITISLEPYQTQLGPTFLRITEQVVLTPLLLAALLIAGLRTKRPEPDPLLAAVPRGGDSKEIYRRLHDEGIQELQ